MSVSFEVYRIGQDGRRELVRSTQSAREAREVRDHGRGEMLGLAGVCLDLAAAFVTKRRPFSSARRLPASSVIMRPRRRKPPFRRGHEVVASLLCQGGA